MGNLPCTGSSAAAILLDAREAMGGEKRRLAVAFAILFGVACGTSPNQTQSSQTQSSDTATTNIAGKWSITLTQQGLPSSVFSIDLVTAAVAVISSNPCSGSGEVPAWADTLTVPGTYCVAAGNFSGTLPLGSLTCSGCEFTPEQVLLGAPASSVSEGNSASINFDLTEVDFSGPAHAGYYPLYIFQGTGQVTAIANGGGTMSGTWSCSQALYGADCAGIGGTFTGKTQ
jgi:hypothetical protein